MIQFIFSVHSLGGQRGGRALLRALLLRARVAARERRPLRARGGLRGGRRGDAQAPRDRGRVPGGGGVLHAPRYVGIHLWLTTHND